MNFNFSRNSGITYDNRPIVWNLTINNARFFKTKMLVKFDTSGIHLRLMFITISLFVNIFHGGEGGSDMLITFPLVCFEFCLKRKTTVLPVACGMC